MNSLTAGMGTFTTFSRNGATPPGKVLARGAPGVALPRDPPGGAGDLARPWRSGSLDPDDGFAQHVGGGLNFLQATYRCSRSPRTCRVLAKERWST